MGARIEVRDNVLKEAATNNCYAIQSGCSQIQLTFADGTIVQANGADAQALLDNIKSFIKQGEMRGIGTGGPFKWTFTVKGTACNLTPEDLL
jgi:uncharacterized protein YuzB (UPF0349 family)